MNSQNNCYSALLVVARSIETVQIYVKRILYISIFAFRRLVLLGQIYFAVEDSYLPAIRASVRQGRIIYLLFGRVPRRKYTAMARLF